MLPKSALPYDLGATLNHARRVMGDPLSGEVENTLRKVFSNLQCTLRRYGWAGQEGLNERARRLEYHLCTSYGFRLIGVLHGYPKKSAKITWAEVRQLANRANPHCSPGGAVTVAQLEKIDGGYRPITTFQRVARANQSMARDLIHVRNGHSRYEYAQRGRGREKLISSINNSNRNGGVRALGTLDVKDCFLGIRREAVSAVISLSKAIINNTIYIHHDVPIVMKTALISENAVRAGLPQGSLSSVVVAGKVLEPCLAKLQSRFVGSYIDDVQIGEGSVEEVQATLDTLAVALKEQHPNSPLFVKCMNAFKIGRHANILGYWPRPQPAKYGGGLKFSPSETALRRFYCRLTVKLLQRPASSWDEVTEEQTLAWGASYQHWGGKLGGLEFAQTAYHAVIAPLFDEAHKTVLAAIDAGKSKVEVKSLATGLVKSLMPPCVLVNVMGLCPPLDEGISEQVLF
jgi:hypothetical protein